MKTRMTVGRCCCDTECDVGSYSDIFNSLNSKWMIVQGDWSIVSGKLRGESESPLSASNFLLLHRCVDIVSQSGVVITYDVEMTVDSTPSGPMRPGVAIWDNNGTFRWAIAWEEFRDRYEWKSPSASGILVTTASDPTDQEMKIVLTESSGTWQGEFFIDGTKEHTVTGETFNTVSRFFYGFSAKAGAIDFESYYHKADFDNLDFSVV